MKKNISILFLLILTTFFSCNTDEIKYVNIEIDPKQEHDISINDIFNSINLIPLETKKECIIGKIGKIIYYENEYYISDKMSKDILMFDKNGNYKNRIGKIGRGPGEYIALQDFEINTKTGNIEVLSIAPSRLIEYNKSGEHIRTKYLPKKTDFCHYFKYTVDNNLVLFSLNAKYRIIHYDIQTNKVNVIKKQIPDYIATKTLFNPSGSPLYIYDNNVFFNEAFSNTVYKLDAKSMNIDYKWDFNNYNFDINVDLPKNKEKDYYTDYYLSNSKKYIYYFPFNIQNSNYLINTYFFDSKLHCAIFNKSNYNIYQFTRFKEGGFFPNSPTIYGDSV